MTKSKEVKQEAKTEQPKQEVAPKAPSIADKIWTEIKDKPIDMFGLPGQKVSEWCTPQFVEPSKLYVVIKVGAVLQTLVDHFYQKYDIELLDKWVVIAPKKVIK